MLCPIFCLCCWAAKLTLTPPTLSSISCIRNSLVRHILRIWSQFRKYLTFSFPLLCPMTVKPVFCLSGLARERKLFCFRSYKSWQRCIIGHMCKNSRLTWAFYDTPTDRLKSSKDDLNPSLSEETEETGTSMDMQIKPLMKSRDVSWICGIKCPHNSGVNYWPLKLPGSDSGRILLSYVFVLAPAVPFLFLTYVFIFYVHFIYSAIKTYFGYS